MVRGLLGNVECLAAGGFVKVPMAGEVFAKDRVQGFLDTAERQSAIRP